MQTLIKYASRERPELFAQTFAKWNTGRVRFVVTLDSDDANLPEYQAFLAGRDNVRLDIGEHHGKIDAINSGVAGETFDIVIAAADDMIPQRPDYDLIIEELFHQFAPDLDGAVYFPDGRRPDQLNTSAIFGRKYYQRFGFLYNPVYRSLFADNELTEVSRKLGKEIRYPDVLIKHEWVAVTGRDELHLRNESFFLPDMMIYRQRKANGFPCKLAS